MSGDDSLTELLRAAHAGDREAADRAYRVLYPELCKIARAHLRANRPDTLLDTRGLVFEGYLNLAKVDGALFENRRHFYAYAAKVMRRIVIDFARRRQAQRHGGGAVEGVLTTSIASMEKHRVGTRCREVIGRVGSDRSYGRGRRRDALFRRLLG